MAKSKKTIKAKEPIRIRFKELANRNKSIYLDFYRDGKRVYEFLKLYIVPEVDEAAKIQNQNTLQAANAIKAKRLIDLTNNEAGIKPKKQQTKILLLDWVNQVKAKLEQKGSTTHMQMNLLKIALSAYNAERVMLKDVDKRFCIGFCSFLSNRYISKRTGMPVSSATAKMIDSMLCLALNEAVKAEMIGSNPFEQIDADDKVKVHEKPREYLTISEIKQMIAAPCPNEEVKHAYLFSCYCGLRISDVRALTWADVHNDGKQCRLEIVMKKTKEVLYIPLSNQALRWMPERNGAADSDRVFALPSITTIEKCLSQWAAAANVNKHVTFHTSRHTFATMMLTLGADIYTTSKLLGHAQLETTQRYAKIVNKKKDDAVNLVNGIFDD